MHTINISTIDITNGPTCTMYVCVCVCLYVVSVVMANLTLTHLVNAISKSQNETATAEA